MSNRMDLSRNIEFEDADDYGGGGGGGGYDDYNSIGA